VRLIAATVALLALPFGVEAQGSRMSKVGVLENDLTRFDAFRQELRKLGWQEKKNVTFEIRTGRDEELPRLAAGLVTSKVDVIFAPTSAAVQASKAATAKIPIVFATAADPVGSGFVARLGSPGGNVSGLTSIFAELNGKRLELLKVVIPGT
jgi:putative ABC transport system substrate-binding protein